MNRTVVGVAVVGAGLGAILWGASRTGRLGSRDVAPLLQPMLDVWTAIRAQQDLYQALHWRASGNVSYGDHLLYERLYKGRLEELDRVAERIAGLFGDEALDPQVLVARSAAWLSRWREAGKPVAQALAAESDLQRAIRKAHDAGKETQTLTLGLDDLLASLASAHEESTYLLRQRGKAGSKNARMSLADAVAMAKDAWAHGDGVIGIDQGKGAIVVHAVPGFPLPFPAEAWGWPVRVRASTGSRPKA